MIVTGTSLQGSKEAIRIAREHGVYATVGCHPTESGEITNPDEYFQKLESLIDDKVVCAIGEIGLDYDRLQHASRETQLAHLPRLLRLASTYNLPLFLHSRHSDAHVDLISTLASTSAHGCIHSFTGTRDEMLELVQLGWHIGVNGCSLKTPELLDVVAEIPLDRLLLETDAPWCSITTTSAASKHLPSDAQIPKTKTFKAGSDSGVKGRNEPGDILAVAHVVAAIKGISMEEVAEAAWRNTIGLYFPWAKDQAA